MWHNDFRTIYAYCILRYGTNLCVSMTIDKQYFIFTYFLIIFGNMVILVLCVGAVGGVVAKSVVDRGALGPV